MANLGEDQHRSEAKLMFKIDNFADFARQPRYSDRDSEPIFIRGIEWKVRAVKSETRPEHMGIYVYCVPERPTSDFWTCEAAFTLAMVPQRDQGTQQGLVERHHVFYAKSKNCGIQLFKRFEELLHPANGWYDPMEDSITIEADVKAKMARGFGFPLNDQWYRAGWNYFKIMHEPGQQGPFCTIECISWDRDVQHIKTFWVDTKMLATHSDVFGAMFAHEETKECKKMRLVIEDSTARAVHQMIFYAYFGHLPSDLSGEDAAELLKIADKYNIEPLAANCEENLMESLCVANVCHYLALADRHNAHSLRIACGHVIRCNLATVKGQTEWKALKKSHSQLLVEILEELTKKDFI